MRERIRAFLLVGAPLAALVAVVHAGGSRTEFLVALLLALVSASWAIEVWLWARCRRWPIADSARVEPASPDAGTGARIQYEFRGDRYSRPVPPNLREVGEIVVRVNPADPELSSVTTSAPRARIALLCASVAALLALAVHVAV